MTIDELLVTRMKFRSFERSKFVTTIVWFVENAEYRSMLRLWYRSSAKFATLRKKKWTSSSPV